MAHKQCFITPPSLPFDDVTYGEVKIVGNDSYIIKRLLPHLSFISLCLYFFSLSFPLLYFTHSVRENKKYKSIVHISFNDSQSDM